MSRIMNIDLDSGEIILYDSNIEGGSQVIEYAKGSPVDKAAELIYQLTKVDQLILYGDSTEGPGNRRNDPAKA